MHSHFCLNIYVQRNKQTSYVEGLQVISFFFFESIKNFPQ